MISKDFKTIPKINTHFDSETEVFKTAQKSKNV